ncbi:MAG: hypothetical protein B9S32_04445 [Verrucomicrobia bacterium Tous-C9LFEB]|nr:MAG: hypothetical protein B9S32_04445 [Verrucomicrobia bacterium Tous-C9LFEB]
MNEPSLPQPPTLEAASNFDLIGLGYCSWDFLCVVPEVPMDGKVEILSRLEQGGGPSATATFAAQRLGARTAFIGAVGNDDVGRKILNDFSAEGVDVSAMVTRTDEESGVSYCWAEQKKGKRSIAWIRGTAAPLRPLEINEALLRSSRVLHLDGHQTEAAIHAAAVAKAAGVTVCLDAGTIVPGIELILKNVDIVIASESFAERYTQENTIEKQLFALRKNGARWAVITCGERGSMGYDGQEWIKVPAVRISQVVDTTGAGDVYHGAFLRRYLDGVTMGDCMRFASGAAALKCGALGGRTAIPTLARLNEFLSQSNP